jgi:phosphopentomutase
MDRDFSGLVFANCVDFDMLYGHRNDAPGYAAALKDFDKWLGENLPKLRPDDYMIVTGDHGGDPTTSSTDHSREYVPLLIFIPGAPQGIDLGIRESFSDIAASLCYWFQLEPWPVGKEFASQIENYSL